MRVVLVHTGISRCGFNSYGTSQEASWISHGLCSLSAIAKQAGYRVELIDLRRLTGWRAFRKELIKRQPDVLGFTMMTVDFNVVKRGILECRKVLPNVKIVIGGPHPSIAPNDVLEIREVDFVVQGEGELVFLDLLNAINNDTEFPRQIVGRLADLDALPFADRSLYPLPETPFHPIFPPPFVTIITGRGCIYNCSFCQPAERMIFGRKVRRRSIDNVLKELEILKETTNFQSFMIHDDCLTEDEDWVHRFCDAYISAGFKKPFICQTRADIIVKKTDMIRHLSAAGLKMFSIGFESGNDRILKLLRKGTTVEQNYKAAEICRELGILIDANYMLGMPTETEEEMMDTVRMINTINPEIRSAAFFTPHIGTDLYDYCLENKLLLPLKHYQFRRNPYGKKIKGVDYKIVRKMLWKSRGPFRLSHIRTFISDQPIIYKTLKWINGILNPKFRRFN